MISTYKVTPLLFLQGDMDANTNSEKLYAAELE